MNTDANNFTVSIISRNEAGQMYDARHGSGDDTFETVEAAKARAVEVKPFGDVLIYNEVTGETVVGYVASGAFVEEFHGDWNDAKAILNEV